MAQKLIDYFEKLSPSTDKNKLPLERTVNSKSGGIKKLVNDFTEIKRSPRKSQVLDNNELYVRAKTIGKSLRVTENEYIKRHAEITKQIRCKEDEKLSQTCTNSYTRTNETGSDNKEEKTDVTVNRTSHVVNDINYEIKWNIEEFGKKRTKQQCEDVNSLGFQSQDEKSEEEHIQEEICDSFYSFDSEDIFGLNDFSDDDTDNYILQCYNDDGRELIKTQLEITNTVLLGNDIENSKIDELLEYPDSVFYQNTSRQNDRVLTDFSQLVENSSQNEHLPNNVNFIDTPKEEVDNESHFFDSDIYEEIDGCAFYNPNKNISEQANGYNTAIISEEDSSSFTYYRLQSEQIQEDNLYHNLDDLQKHDSDDIFLDDNQNLLKRKSEKRDKISYVIDELIKTEELYISNLKTVVKKYLRHLYSKIEKPSYIFGNIEKIYEAAKVFLELLKKCDQNADEIAKVFIECSDSFDLYPQYFKNKPTANLYLIEFDTIAKERQMELEDNQTLASYLLTPIQRLGKYVLLLENIQKELLNRTGETLDSVNSAINIIRNVLQKGNDSIAIDSIKQCKIQLTEQGSFIMRANFNILKPRKFTSMVFLFEKVIVFTEEIAKNIEQFNYVCSIQMADLGIVKFEDNSFVFHLKDFLKKNNHDVLTYVLEAKDLKIKNNWTMAIEAKLWCQFQKAIEQQKQMNSDFEAGEELSKVPLQRGSIIQKLPAKKEKPPIKKSKFYDAIGTLTKNAHNAFQPFINQH